MHDSSENDELATLRATYQRLSHERDRLRDARGFFARGLGPAPASAGIATGVVAALGDGKNPGFLFAAVGVLVAMVTVSIAYDGALAYRHLYARRIKALRSTGLQEEELLPKASDWHQKPEDRLREVKWYRAMISVEREIYGPEYDHNRFRLPCVAVTNLQDGVDLERTGVRLVQGLWVVVVGLLVAATVV